MVILEQHQDIKELIFAIIKERLRDLKATSNVEMAKEKAKLIQILVEIKSRL
ncbi:hypothetical protein [Fervidibacillus albus]|uniref:Uncharacterized protein n=1 Tax=Fervidibacillus albus TaxID=2980026 RepID=A0A9E8RWH2_9BACI|nr:hypothetical protein [Fervidibacillus albus]WAA10304.1 hypothetical protein OE104_02925 [Fervidibacillus albus]